MIDAGRSLLFRIGPTFVFPTASEAATGQGKWQVGPQLRRRLPAQVAARSARAKSNLIRWRSQTSCGKRVGSSTIHHLPVRSWMVCEIRAADVFRLGDGKAVAADRHRHWSGLSRLVRNTLTACEPAWNTTHDGPAPRYSITFGFALLYPSFWRSRAER